MESITQSTHEIIKDVNGIVIVEDGKVYVRNKPTDGLYLIPLSEAKIVFEIHVETDEQTTSVDTSSNETSTSSSSLTWSKDINIKLLITLYAKYESDFKSTKIRNETVWKKISNEIGCYTSKQCSDKFKYLKQKYIKKKDNMGPNQTGAEYMKFEYFNEFEEIFGKKPNILPVAVATSLKGDTILHNNEEKLKDDEPCSSAPPSKKKKLISKESNMEKLVDFFKTESKIKEENRQRRHEERLAAYNTKMDALIKKM